MRLRDGDVIISYVCFSGLHNEHFVADFFCSQTDGLSDNVFSSEMASMCSLVSRAGGSDEYQVQAIADTMVQYSRSCMVNKTRVSPFERKLFVSDMSTFPDHETIGRAAREGMYFRGGVSALCYLLHLLLTRLSVLET